MASGGFHRRSAASRRTSRRRHGGLVAAGFFGALLSACRGPAPGVDLGRLSEDALAEASVAGRDRSWVVGQLGKQIRIDDDVRRTLPASPPSRLRFALDVPARATLTFAHAIAPKYYGEPGVEFVVKVAAGGDERTAWTRLLDPISHAQDRGWVAARVDLSAYAGRHVDLILETRGFEPGDDPRRAFWSVPALTTDAQAPLAVIYLVDTLRADHTTPYGYDRDTTPALAGFARDAVVFDAAISHASWTKPSVASIFTSQLPGRHRAVQLRDRLDVGLVTLAEMLDAKGCGSGAAIANSVIYSQGTQFEQGFDFFAGIHGADDRPSKLVNTAGVVDAALGWLDRRGGLPSFVYVHTMDPHVPYSPPPPYDHMFEPHPTEDHPGVDPRTDYKEPLDRDRLIAQYDGSIAYGDRQFGRFVDALKQRGLYDRALIVFVADHGEEFQDHGHWLHGRSVFDELVRVPLIVKWPGQKAAGTRVSTQVQLVDLLPTVLRHFGFPIPPPPAITGQPLQAVLAGDAPEPPAVSEISHRGFVAHGMRTRQDKYVHNFSPEDAEMYFELENDPGEKDNVIDRHAERVRVMRAGLEAAMAPNPFRDALRLVGAGEYELTLRTNGWFLGVEPHGLAGAERAEVEANGRRLVIRARPTRDRPRDIVFGVRPQGAPVTLEGTRDGRPLRGKDVLIAREAVHPEAVPFTLPEIETESGRVANIFEPPPAGRPGLHVWLVMGPGRDMIEFDSDAQQHLKALGYLN